MKPLTKITNYIVLAALILTLNIPFALSSPVPASTSPLELAFMHKSHGDHLLKEGNASLSIPEYEKAIELNPDLREAYFNLAIAYYSERKIEKAAEALEKLLLLDPSDVEARYNLACLSLYLQDIEKAKFHFQKAQKDAVHAPAFAPLIHQALRFLDELADTNTPTQEILFFLLRQGLPSLTLVS